MNFVEGVPISRLYNPNSGEHFYTGNEDEVNALCSKGWDYKGYGWISPKTSGCPVFRLYNPNAGDHHYTMNVAERDDLVKKGWKNEDVAFYSTSADGQLDGVAEWSVYRQYNKNAKKAGAHNYTINPDERDTLVSKGWKDEGEAWYTLDPHGLQINW